MKNKALEQRLDGNLKTLMAAFEAGKGQEISSTCSKGREREIFVDYFLREFFPPQFRFGSGEIVDQQGNSSGQLDIVIEFPFLPSFPTLFGNGPRLYLAEGAAAVIEVKSYLTSEKEWDEVLTQAERVSKLRCEDNICPPDNTIWGSGKRPQIPYFVVSYEGWKDISILQAKVAESSDHISGILIIKNRLFYGSIWDLPDGIDKITSFDSDPSCLMCLIHCIHMAVHSAREMRFSPISYCDIDNNV